VQVVTLLFSERFRRSFGVFLLVCAQTGCRFQNNANSVHAKIAAMRLSEPKNALVRAKQAYEQSSGAAPETAWRFRLLYADVLLDTNQLDQAAPLLQGEIPPGPEHGGLAARLAVSKVRLASKNNDNRLTGWLLEDAQRLLPASHDPCLPVELLTLKIKYQTLEGLAVESAKGLDEMETLARSCPDRYWEALRLFLRGTNLLSDYRVEEAIVSYTNGLALARQNNLKMLTPLLLGNLASCYLYLGDLDKSLRSLDDAEEAYGETGQAFDRSIDRGRRGEIYALLHQSSKALAEYEQALQGARVAQDQAYEARWLNELTALKCEIGDLRSAERTNNEALKNADQTKGIKEYAEDYAAAQMNAARIARLRKEYPAAYRLLQPLGGAGERKSFHWQVQAERAQLLAAMNKSTAARTEFAAALETAESARGEVNDVWHRMTFSSQVLELYRRYVDFLVDHGDSTRALRVAESSHARQLLERLHSTEKAEATADFAAVARGQQAIILSYWVGDVRSYLWVTTPHGCHLFPLGDTRKLAAQIQNYRREIEDGADFLRNPESSIKLYNTLIAPAARLIPANAAVVVIPDGPLADLNFETLIAPGTTPRYWLEEVSLRVAPSMTLLHSREVPLADIGRALLVGGTNPPAPFLPLPGSQHEIDAIEKLFHANQPTVLSGDGATAVQFLKASPEGFSLIHLSAHAVAVKENPLDSAIIFTPETPGGNFKLYARQLSSMKLKANLVTLSACRGAGARAVPGEGLVGLTWALLSAGAHNVVAGLWDVPDEASARLMERFYSGLHEGKTPEQALRSAKLTMRRQAPYYWAAFQLYTR
jgi:CHAT domain-containing protein